MPTVRLTTDSSNATGQQRAQREIHGVVFDMDGLLLDTERIYCQIFQELAKEHGYELSDAGYLRMVGHRIERSKAVLADEIGTPDPVDAIFDELTARYHQRIASRPIPTRPGARELIALLQEHKIPLALATSTHRHLTDAKLHNAGLDNIFSFSVCGDEVELGKPNPDPYLKAVAGLGLGPQQALALEDSPTGLASAATAGLYTILVPDMVAPTAETRAMAGMVLPSLHAVCERISSKA